MNNGPCFVTGALNFTRVVDIWTEKLSRQSVLQDDTLLLDDGYLFTEIKNQ